MYYFQTYYLLGETYYHTTHTEPRLQPEKVEKDIDYKLSMEPMQSLVDKIKAIPNLNLFVNEEPSQCLVNEYKWNMGISSHFDDPHAFGETVVSLSLCEPLFFTLKKPKIKTNGCLEIEQEIKMYLEPRSLLILRGEARYDWRHGIGRARLIHHPITGTIQKRGLEYRRLSITVRKVLDGRRRGAAYGPFPNPETTKPGIKRF